MHTLSIVVVSQKLLKLSIIFLNNERSKFPSTSGAQILRRANEIIREKFAAKNKKQPSHSDLSNSLVSIDIFLSDSPIQRFEEVPVMNFYDLLAELGDYLGMFLGLSLLSSFEIIDLILSLISIYFTNRRNNKLLRMYIGDECAIRTNNINTNNAEAPEHLSQESQKEISVAGKSHFDFVIQVVKSTAFCIVMSPIKCLFNLK
jgi:uncharacterized membrane protein